MIEFLIYIYHIFITYFLFDMTYLCYMNLKQFFLNTLYVLYKIFRNKVVEFQKR